MKNHSLRVGILLVAAGVTLAACGKKGPPLAPLHLIPEPPSGVSVKRVGAHVYIAMVAPKKNVNGPGLLALDHLEVYGVTVGAGFAPPPNREFLTDTYLLGKIPIKPPPDDEQPAEERDTEDTRPGPGEPVEFVEEITEKQLTSAPGLKPLPPSALVTTPVAPWPPSVPLPDALVIETAESPARPFIPPVPPLPAAPPLAAAPATAPAAPPPATTPPAPPAAPAPPPATPPVPGAPAVPGAPPAAAPAPPVAPPVPAFTGPVRIYIVRGITQKGRPGPPSARLTVPLVPPPPPPGTANATFTEQAVTLTWIAPVAAAPDAPPMSFNVYSKPAPSAKAPAAPATAPAASQQPVPLNPAPLTAATFERTGAVVAGVEQCYEVRTVESVASVVVESEPSESICLTPRDIFPPAAPKGLAVVAMEGSIMNLIWDANAEPDLAGYLVLRGEAPGDSLQPVTPQPIHDTKFTDTTVKAGVRYVYAIVAVDKATPPNRSVPSARVEETAR